jgi:hypothetical protein
MAIDHDFKFDTIVTLVAQEIDPPDGENGLRWRLLWPDLLTVIHPSTEKPLDDGARELLDRGFRPDAVLRICSWFTATSYQSGGNCALSGKLADIIGEPWRIEEWERKHRPLLTDPTQYLLRQRVWGDRRRELQEAE